MAITTHRSHRDTALSAVGLLVAMGIAILSPAGPPANAATVAVLGGATTDNYKAIYNAPSAPPDNRTSLMFDSVAVGGVTYVVDQAKSPGDAGGSPKPAPNGVALKVAATGVSDARLVITPVPPAEQGCCGTAQYRIFSSGSVGPWIATNAARFPTHPIDLTLSVVKGGTVLGTAALRYAYDPAVAALGNTTLEYHGPGGRWSVDGVKTPLNWPASIGFAPTTVTPGVATTVKVTPLDISGLTVPQYDEPITLAWSPSGAGRPTTAPGRGERSVSVNVPAGSYSVSASSSCGDLCAPTGAATVTATTAPPPPPTQQVDVRVVSPVLTMQPLDTAPAGSPTSATLKALRGEIESFQVVVRGGNGAGLAGVDVVPAVLTGPGGATIPVGNVSVFAEQYTKVRTPSDLESLDQNGTGTPTTNAALKGWCAFFPAGTNNSCGVPVDYNDKWDSPFNRTWRCGGAVAPVVDDRRCWFPDALVPRTDVYFNQLRNAFPFDVPANENRTVWVDVVIPPGATPGSYTGQLQVTRTGGSSVPVPVSLTVSPVTMPAVGSNPSLELPAGVRGSVGKVCPAVGCGTSNGSKLKTYSLFVRAALENRIPLTTPTLLTPGSGAGLTYFTKWIRPFLAGTGPTATIGGVAPPRLPARQRLVLLDRWSSASDWTAWGKALKAAHASGAMRFYCDEVLGSAVTFRSQCQNPYATASPAWKAATHTTLKTFLVGRQSEWNNAKSWGSAARNSDTLVTNTYFLHLRQGTNQRPSYDAAPNGYLTTAGRALWGYDSNNATGGPATVVVNGRDTLVPDWSVHPTYNGYPTIGAVDQPATSERATGPMAWAYRLGGQFYYEAFASFADAWGDCNTGPCLYNGYGGHGDGTLFYPGPSSRFAKPGTTVEPIPIESMRLKRFRDGSEDYSLLRLLETGCRGACHVQTRAALAKIVGGPAGAGLGAMPQMSGTSIGSARYDAMRDQLFALLTTGTAPPRATDVEHVVVRVRRVGD